VEIALKQFPLPASELADVLKVLDFSYAGLDADALQRLFGKMPTPEESEKMLKLLAQPNPTQSLTSLEQALEPLCKVSHVERRLRIVETALTHTSQHSALMAQLQTLQTAAMEAIECSRLAKVVRTSLRISNVINYGDVRGQTSFSLSSFATFASFKKGEFSALHYLCYELFSVEGMAAKEFVEGMAGDLVNVSKVARGSTQNLQADVRAFKENVELAREHLDTEMDQAARNRCDTLLKSLEAELTSLEAAQEAALDAGKRVQDFYCERSYVKFEAFLAHIVAVMDSLSKASTEFHHHVDGFKQNYESQEIERSVIVATQEEIMTHNLTAAVSHQHARECLPASMLPAANMTWAQAHDVDPICIQDVAQISAVEERPRRTSLVGQHLEQPKRNQLEDTCVSWLADGKTVRTVVESINEVASVP